MQDSSSAGVQVDKYHDDRLWVIHAFSLSREIVDSWEATVRSYITQIHPPNARYLIYDLSPVPRPTITRYMRERIDALAEDNRDATGRVAIVVDTNPTIRYVADAYLKFTGQRVQPDLEVRFFETSQEAFDWVADSLQDPITEY